MSRDEAQLLEAIKDVCGTSFDQNGTNLGDLATAMRTTKNDVFAMMVALKKQGRLEVVPRKQRRVRRWRVVDFEAVTAEL